MPDLLPELALMVLEYAYHYHSEIPDRRTLAACALVSTSWTEAAQKLLFRSVQIKGEQGYSFIHAIDPTTPRGGQLGSYTRTLEVLVGVHEHRRRNDTWTTLAVSDWITLLVRCPHLYELIIRVFGVHEFDVDTMTTLRDLTASDGRSPLRALSLLRFSVQSPILYQLLSVWPTIQFLRIGMQLAASPPPLPAPFSLYELNLQRIPAPGILPWLLSNSMSTLQIAEFRDIPSGQLTDLLVTSGPRLRSLRLMHYNGRAAAIIRLCPNLEELVLFSLSTHLRLVALPQTLEHLSFRSYTWSASPSLQTIIRALRTLPRLRLVTCDPGAQHHMDYGALQEACAARHIELRADAHPISTMEDPIPVRRFPRRKSVSNFPLMNAGGGRAHAVTPI